MNIKELQNEAAEIVKNMEKKRGNDVSMTLLIMHLIEEFGELGKQLYNDASGRESVDRENIGEELSDMCFLIFALAEYYDVDMNEALSEKLEELKKRYGVG